MINENIYTLILIAVLKIVSAISDLMKPTYYSLFYLHSYLAKKINNSKYIGKLNLFPVG
jgi:hypothetical protein